MRHDPARIARTGHHAGIIGRKGQAGREALRRSVLGYIEIDGDLASSHSGHGHLSPLA